MKVPSSAYRLQFNSSFRFKDALNVIEYLDSLGITDIYASPVSKARKGSLHGYDIVDHNRINPEVGSEEELRELLAKLKPRAMGWVQDIVPNHMAYDSANWMLMDVMEKGRVSKYDGFFDIEWDHPYEGIKDKVLAPFLGRIYGEALEAGEIKLRFSASGLSAGYYDFEFPLKTDSYSFFLASVLAKLSFQLGREHPDFIKLLGVLYVIKNLPASGTEDELYDQTAFVKRMLWELYGTNSDIKKGIDETLSAFNGAPGAPESFNMLDRLLGEQYFKLSFWKVAAEEVNYRRFFNINGLISLRTEDGGVFEKVHSLLFSLLGDGITGLRVDHIDGLLTPLSYLRRLRERAEDAYIIVEKILDRDEELPFTWPVEGTTGYEFLNQLNGIFIETGNEERLTRTYFNFIGKKQDYRTLFYEKKKLITEMDMMSDVANLAQLLKMTLSGDRYGTDITLQGLRKAIVEVMAEFPVYRTYISGESITDTDIRYIKQSVYRAIGRNPALLNELTFIEKVLTLNYREYLSEAEKAEWLKFVMRFQQFTGPLMAKGIEDTLFYVYNRLISLNEVGGSPAVFGRSLDSFHSRCRNSASLRPHTMNATATHDTKRGEDARARINVLSELPDEWSEHLKRWSALNRRRKWNISGLIAPDKNDEYFLYQTLLGSFPFEYNELQPYRRRIRDYVIKAVREAKIHTAWLRPDKDYEEAFAYFTEEILANPGGPFLSAFQPFQRKVAWYGMINSLSQSLVKIASPGVPDFYQGSELWDLSLVDPDNRGPVDFEKRKGLLEKIRERAGSGPGGLVRDLLENPWDGRIKLFLMHAALTERRRLARLFMDGLYLPIDTEGQFSRNTVAFARVKDDSAVLIIAPRLATKVVTAGEWPVGQSVWGDTRLVLPEGLAQRQWRNIFTGERVSGGIHLHAGVVFNAFPAAFLVAE